MLSTDNSDQRIPPLLFRAYSSRHSGGQNDEDGFGSIALRNGGDTPKRLNDLSFEHARTLIWDHVVWSRRWRDDDMLISFTPSFLFALQMCMYKVHGKKNRAEDWYICVIDTSGFPAGTWQSTVKLLETYNLGEDDDSKLAHRYHGAEYLAEWEISFADRPDCSKSVSFQQLLYAGLSSLTPKCERDTLIHAVDCLRELYTSSESKEIGKEDILLASKSGMCFGSRWYREIVVWGLALRRRPIENRRLREYFGTEDDLYWKDAARFGDLLAKQAHLMPVRLQELDQWYDLMIEVYQYRLNKPSTIQNVCTEEHSESPIIQGVDDVDSLTSELTGLKV